MKKHLLPLLALSAVTAANAATLTQFTFESDTLANSVTSPTGFTASTSLGLNNGLTEVYTTSLGTNIWAPGSGYGTGQDATGFTTANAGAFNISTGAYVSFTVTPTGGNTINLDKLTLDYRANHTDRSADNFAVFANVGGGDDLTDALFVGFVGTTQDASVTSAGVTATNVGSLGTNVTGIEVDLSGSAVASISSATEFRIYLFGVSTNTNSGSLTTFGDIALTGAVVPEPSSAAMLVGGLGAFMLLRRRRA